ncbi:hypothetical protein [Cohnella fermenti]|uniref:Uncharacterized protein n=1 Tax=Cohnella fermenti TaxID=2565925 RepID=A0A4V3WG82_9BACL|nr:hypothetical protein [Cohnella fermenti]THF82721.1 hypothetical protein E6C55_06575 [Cohnella fermenti]
MWYDVTHIGQRSKEVADLLVLNDVRTLTSDNSSGYEKAISAASLTPWGKLFAAGKIAHLFIIVGKNSDEIITGFKSFDDLKKVLGSAGENKAWHHIVEQSQVQRSGFKAEDIQNINNVISIPSGYSGSVHSQISGYYSSIQPFTNGLTVRNWLAGQSFEKQFDFGLNVLKRFGTVTQTEKGWIFTPNS